MDANQFRILVRRVASTLSFAWLQTKPELLQTYHQLAIGSSSELAGIRAQLDEPIHDLVMGTQITPSEMQAHLLDTVVPTSLVAIQSIAEDALDRLSGAHLSVFQRIEALASSDRIDRNAASTAHHWRMIRNVVAHACGEISQATEDEAADLAGKHLILFCQFSVWGPLVDAGHGGSLVPIHERATKNPTGARPSIDIKKGQRVDIGVADLLAAGDAWAILIAAAV